MWALCRPRLPAWGGPKLDPLRLRQPLGGWRPIPDEGRACQSPSPLIPRPPWGRRAAHRGPRARGKCREGDAGGFDPGPGRNRV